MELAVWRRALPTALHHLAALRNPKRFPDARAFMLQAPWNEGLLRDKDLCNEKANPNASQPTHHTGFDLAWTIIRVMILVVIALPSFRLLEHQLIPPTADLMVKVSGHQWYWTYDYPKDQGGGFTRDPVVIATHFHLSSIAPFIVDVDATPGPAGWPKGGTTERDLPNNHLNYALTWFGLAGRLLCVFMAFVMRKFAEA